MPKALSELRRTYHKEILDKLLGLRPGAEHSSNADSGSALSVLIAEKLAAKMAGPTGSQPTYVTPRVSVIDLKSGHPDSDRRTSLNENLMRLQVTLYGLAAKRELEYEPDRGLVRYLGEQNNRKKELVV